MHTMTLENGALNIPAIKWAVNNQVKRLVKQDRKNGAMNTFAERLNFAMRSMRSAIKAERAFTPATPAAAPKYSDAATAQIEQLRFGLTYSTNRGYTARAARVEAQIATIQQQDLEAA